MIHIAYTPFAFKSVFKVRETKVIQNDKNYR